MHRCILWHKILKSPNIRKDKILKSPNFYNVYYGLLYLTNYKSKTMVGVELYPVRGTSPVRELSSAWQVHSPRGWPQQIMELPVDFCVLVLQELAEVLMEIRSSADLSKSFCIKQSSMGWLLVLLNSMSPYLSTTPFIPNFHHPRPPLICNDFFNGPFSSASFYSLLLGSQS